ncbi:MAG: MerR family transcriptional regulator [Candidatus Kapabacteria bacterium]|nr:MerR family transcriptional regulator [Candidatus Kapabacteria bacterium]
MQESIKKLYYSITEAAKIVAEEQHVLRYWEREFSQLKPQKNRAGNRIYSARDMAVLMLIRKLLREQRFTVAGAKEFLRQNGLPEDLNFSLPEESAPNDAAADVAESVISEVGQGAEQHTDRNADNREILELIREIRAFSAEIRSKTGRNTSE